MKALIWNREKIFRYFRFCEHIFAAGALCAILYFLTFDISVIVSDSMSPTLKGTSRKNGDWILMEKVSYLFRSPRRWEIVAFRNDLGMQVMKRVVALPGESIAINNLNPVINSTPVKIPQKLDYLKYYRFGNLHDKDKPFKCGNGYYLLGDNSRDSDDSRYNGALNPDEIIGRPLLRIWPPARFGFVNP